jgi:hypothetical protein
MAIVVDAPSSVDLLSALLRSRSPASASRSSAGRRRMARYLVTYHGSEMSHQAEAMAQARNAFMAWAQKAGSALVEPGAPVVAVRTLSSSGTSEQPAEGPLQRWSVVEAENQEAVAGILADHPFLSLGWHAPDQRAGANLKSPQRLPQAAKRYRKSIAVVVVLARETPFTRIAPLGWRVRRRISLPPNPPHSSRTTFGKAQG